MRLGSAATLPKIVLPRSWADLPLVSEFAIFAFVLELGQCVSCVGVGILGFGIWDLGFRIGSRGNRGGLSPRRDY